MPDLSVPGTSFRTIFILFGLLFFSGALLRSLNGGEVLNATGATTVGETISVQIIGTLLYVIAGALLWRNWDKMFFSTEIVILALIMFVAFLSAAWSDDPLLSLRRSAALAGTTIFGLAFATMFNERQILSLLSRFSVLFIAFTAVLAVIAPSYAFHQITDLTYSEHAGQLRGSYFHKNGLGHSLGLFLVVLIVFGKAYLGKLERLVSIAVGFALLAATNSIEGIFATILALGITFALSNVGSTRNSIEKIVLITSVVLALLILVVVLLYTPAYLVALNLFGRDATLSNRTLIWRLVFLALQNVWFFGAGYGVAWHSTASVYLTTGLHQDVGYAHNGYLQTCLELGLVGFSIVMVYIVLAWRLIVPSISELSNNLFMRIGLAFLIYYLVVNIVDVRLMVYNDLDWCLLVAFTQAARISRHAALPLGRLQTSNLKAAIALKFKKQH